MIALKAYREQQATPVGRRIEENMEMVRRLAWHFHGRVGRFIEIDDILQAGHLGLVDAAQRYAEQEGVAFSAYAAIRVRGAIIDFLRLNSNLCRNTIAMQSRAKQAEARLSRKLQRDPEPAEIAAELGLSLEEYDSWTARFQVNRMASLDEVYSDHSILFQGNEPTPEDHTQNRQVRALLRQALTRLPEREALVLQLYYVEELNIYEVASILGVTTGRVSQIKKAAITRLRDLMRDGMDLEG
ncbi:RNA polymerase sigma-28 (SigD/FliA/WhiG) subunit [Rhodovulum bhavnagarense]|uniref:RNA polymerase sigma-28 (SigD/FliA/WhiG) subunit n=1 Tax=Rhodovulum bhavnagarense TaxID=992286 RepID=A0A4R2RFD8_9RHOB|nr:FliA/WhiG family RNA polymerase sigma factor [Rhodovulum bhavnagarense]TCP61354.1 RNA polymerase sigma-28 (SigD/FliA/WhiG) subunit [Rhodovulum bhavnagarense]